ncbi:hypothetical protein UFOVP326_93 [uncultured Caudovirales phage]|uniref:Uncharacterized protein n=1 Tax=uncultured Caudovirales phage TaxID=2100421 RepID=A0A6J5LTN9_9CAUD|nr:hypothetical protein UFOVP326_93 [uncultured Caudovirales phage]
MHRIDVPAALERERAELRAYLKAKIRRPRLLARVLAQNAEWEPGDIIVGWRRGWTLNQARWRDREFGWGEVCRLFGRRAAESIPRHLWRRDGKRRRIAVSTVAQWDFSLLRSRRQAT